MNKVLLASPAMTNSGYGCHSREILESIERMDNVDLMISLMAWGNCSWLSYGDIKERIIRYSQKNAVGFTAVLSRSTNSFLADSKSKFSNEIVFTISF